MNLSDVQYADVYDSVSSALSNDCHSSLPFRVNVENDGDTHQYIALEVLPPHSALEKYDQHISHGSKTVILKARPVFPNALLSTEICVSLPSIRKNRASPIFLGTALANNLHHRLHDPLPRSLGHQLYLSTYNIVVILENELKRNPPDPELMGKLYNVLNNRRFQTRIDHPVKIPLYLENSQSKSSWGTLHSQSVKFSSYKITHPYHRLNVIGRSSIVLCDTASIAVDSLRASVPIMFVSDIPSGFESLQEYFNSFLFHHDRSLLLNQQIAALNDILEEQCAGHYVLNNQLALKRLIWKSMGMSDNVALGTDEALTMEFGLNSQNSLVLNTQQNFTIDNSNTTKLKSSLAKNRRKLQKFKESPKRFMEDSQHSLLRSIPVGKIR